MGRDGDAVEPNRWGNKGVWMCPFIEAWGKSSVGCLHSSASVGDMRNRLFNCSLGDVMDSNPKETQIQEAKDREPVQELNMQEIEEVSGGGGVNPLHRG